MSGTVAVPVARSRQFAAALPELLFVVGAFAVTAGLAAANGGFFPVSWGWSALALFFVAAVTLIVRTEARLGRLELGFLGLVTALVAWTLLSSAWSIDFSSSILEAQRGLVLIGAVAAVFALAPARPVRPLLAAVGAAITVDCAYALATRLFPVRIGSYDPLAVYRLNTPIGYWNGLGVFAAIGAVIALGFAARGTRTVTRARRRGEPARARADALLHLQPRLVARPLCRARRARRTRLAPAPACGDRALHPALACAGGAARVAHARADAAELDPPAGGARRPPARARSPAVRGRRRGGRDLGAGGRAERRLRAHRSARVRSRADRRRARGPRCGHGALRQPADDRAQGLRLVHVVADDEQQPQRAALQPLEQRPHRALARRLAGGEGASDRRRREPEATSATTSSTGPTRSRCRTRTASTSRRSPSSAPPGLVLLLAVLALPLVAMVRLRRHPLVPVAGAAYAVYLVHAIADWDWELAGVTLAAVLCGLACLLAAREEREPPAVSVRARAGVGAAVTALGVVALLGLIGNTAVAASDSAAQNGNWKSAERHARTAIRWQPWSDAGWQRLAEAQLGARRPGRRAAEPAEGDRHGRERLGHLARPRRRLQRRHPDRTRSSRPLASTRSAPRSPRSTAPSPTRKVFGPAPVLGAEG